MKTILLVLVYFQLTDSFAQKNIEYEVYSYVLEIKDRYKTNDALVDSNGSQTTGENQQWESYEKKIKTADDLKGLNFKGFILFNQVLDKKIIITTWVDCADLLVIEIRKKTRSKKLNCELIKQITDHVTRPELLACK